MKAIGLCHNGKPVYESRVNGASAEPESTEADQDFRDDNRTYQTPVLMRYLTSLQLKTPAGHILTYYILQILPFTSESKHMGINVRMCIQLQVCKCVCMCSELHISLISNTVKTSGENMNAPL
ncbi:probable phospholipid-transporting ATPase IIB [Carassius gibelio]|uniref:probable phospholipid-transporting ATPase IIB n=1 Tax=Carassius gibelio TaxID=101364 RepID=UPI00227801BE|nr:probable phospholipid-transporting ATPase IIB [Carassius gibelio]